MNIDYVDSQELEGETLEHVLSEQNVALMPNAAEYTLSSIKLTKDLKSAATSLAPAAVRYLVDRYYQLQRNRIRAANQTRENEALGGATNELLEFIADHNWKLECAIKLAMKHFTLARPEGAWLNSLHGIGPVLSAGLLAHLDVTVPRTVAGWWRFAGLDPTVQWKKKQKRPWNVRLKSLCWKVGDSIVKTHNSPNQFYGDFYKRKKAYLIEQNERGEFKDAAKWKLDNFRIDKSTNAYKCYSKGLLPPAHIDMRARRFVIKMFLSHVYEVFYEIHFQRKAIRPYAFGILGHEDSHYIPPPNWYFKANKIA